MKSSLPRLLACVLVFACAATPAPARQQQPQTQPQPSERQTSEQRPAQSATPAQAVESDEVLQVNTRVVFLDALVTDKKTRALAQDLKPENFEVLADGRPRQLTYFSREGDAARRPLALAVVFDLRRNGAGRYLRRTEILEAMANELAKLPPTDEVAVVALDTGTFGERREWLTPFTRNRAQTASALAVIPSLVGEGSTLGDASPLGGPTPAPSPASSAAPSPSPVPSASPAPAQTGGGDADEAAARERERQREQERKAEADGVSVTVGDDGAGFSSMTMMASTKEELESVYEDLDKKHGRPGERDEVDRFVDKKGREAKRTLKPDGTLLIERRKKDGTYEVSVYNDSNLPGAVLEVSKRLARERPNSQGAIVYVTDGIAMMAYPERDYVEHKMLRQNFIFNALVTDMKTGFKLARPLLSPLGNLIGLNIYGGAQHIAKQTGGEAVRVSRPTDYASGLARIVGNLSARYSLGFTLSEEEADDNRLHTLKVVARAKDAKGKDRKLEVKTRSGYFMPDRKSAKPPADTAKKSEGNDAQAERVKN